jgi:hypothetical protein
VTPSCRLGLLRLWAGPAVTTTAVVERSGGGGRQWRSVQRGGQRDAAAALSPCCRAAVEGGVEIGMGVVGLQRRPSSAIESGRGRR